MNSKREKMVAKQFNTWYPHMLTDLLKHGGSTYSYEGKKKTGFTVGGYGKNTYIVSSPALGTSDLLWFTHHVRRVVEEYEHLLSQQEYYIGTWFDLVENELHIDIVKVFQGLVVATCAGRSNKQECIYNLESGRYHLILPLHKDDPYDEHPEDSGC